MQKELRNIYRNILKHFKKYFKKESDELIKQQILRIKNNVLEEILTYKKYNNIKEMSEELGGILIDSDNLSYAFLLDNIAKNRRTNYVYSIKEFISINKYLNKHFGYKRRYIGEWHTHVSHMPSPSRQDHRAMKLKALVYGKIYLCIAKEAGHTIYFGIYRYTRFGRVIIKLALYEKGYRIRTNKNYELRIKK